jgi:hypothetical protein
MGDVLALASLAQAIALNGLRQNDGRRAAVLYSCFICSVDFDGIVSSQPHARELFVGKMLDHLEQAGIGSEEVLPEVSAALDEIFLILTVADLAHAPDQQTVAIAADQGIPVAAPDDLDDVPASATENGLKFLNDLAIPTNRAVQTLQIAVHDEDQIIEPFARSQRYGAQGLGLIHFAVAEKGPDFAVGGQLQPTIFEIADEPGLVDRLDGTQSHGNSGELPEIRHEPGVRIRREAAAGFQFTTKVLQFLAGYAAFEIGASVHAGGGMALEIDEIAVASLGLGTQEMVKCDLVKSGRRGEG